MSSGDKNGWEYIIVGGGSAGCVLANRLSEDESDNVLLLDAGQSDAHIFSWVPAAIGFAITSDKMNWAYKSLPDKSRAGRSDMWPAGRLLGGGSAINGMMYVRGNRWDYDHWASLGNSGWSFADVLPYFKKLEDNERGTDEYRGTGGPQSVADVRIRNKLTDAFIEGMQEIGVPRNEDLNGASQDGVDYCQVSQRRGFRHSTAKAYLSPIRSRPNLNVELGAFVQRIRFDGRTANGVEYFQNGETRSVTARQGVIVCAGAISSPKILLLSGIGSKSQLAQHQISVVHELPGVGKNLQEHPGVILSAHVTERTLTSDRNPLRAIMHGANYIFRGRGPLSNPVGHAHAFVRTREGLEAPNVQIIFSPLSFDHHEGGATPYPNPAVNFAVGLCRVGSRGEIRLTSAEPNQAPVIDYSLLANHDDIAQLREGIRLTRRIYSTESFGRYFENERKPGEQYVSDEEIEDCIRKQSFLMYHPSGTCKMGKDDMAVVDSKLRVKGVEKLWVADASIFPTIPAGNINATTIMVGEKAADLIRNDREMDN